MSTLVPRSDYDYAKQALICEIQRAFEAFAKRCGAPSPLPAITGNLLDFVDETVVFKLGILPVCVSESGERVAA